MLRGRNGIGYSERLLVDLWRTTNDRKAFERRWTVTEKVHTICSQRSPPFVLLDTIAAGCTASSKRYGQPWSLRLCGERVLGHACLPGKHRPATQRKKERKRKKRDRPTGKVLRHEEKKKRRGEAAARRMQAFLVVAGPASQSGLKGAEGPIS